MLFKYPIRYSNDICIQITFVIRILIEALGDTSTETLEERCTPEFFASELGDVSFMSRPADIEAPPSPLPSQIPPDMSHWGPVCHLLS